MGAATATNKRIAVKLVDMAAQQGLHLPMAIKVPGLTSGWGVQVVRSEKDVKGAIAKLRRAREHRSGKLVDAGQTLMLQEAVQSLNETTINLAAYSGRLLSASAVCFSYSKELYVKLTSSADHRLAKISLPYDDEPTDVREMVSQLLRATVYTGFGCIQYKRTSGGDLRLIEFNPRACGSLDKNPLRLAQLAGSLVVAANSFADVVLPAGSSSLFDAARPPDLRLSATS
mmetsp:Transcript_40622/g.94132  ORF Transcript_40622/g.94132 Transcript_40622/m.94132 type:complete len:229 (+) Transcript_40622:920-1606(+)